MVCQDVTDYSAYVCKFEMQALHYILVILRSLLRRVVVGEKIPKNLDNSLDGIEHFTVILDFRFTAESCQSLIGWGGDRVCRSPYTRQSHLAA